MSLHREWHITPTMCRRNILLGCTELRFITHTPTEWINTHRGVSIYTHTLWEPNLCEPVISWPHVLKQTLDTKIHLAWVIVLFLSLLLSDDNVPLRCCCLEADPSCCMLLTFTSLCYRRFVWKKWSGDCENVLEKWYFPKRLFIFEAVHWSRSICGKWFNPGCWLWMCPHSRKFPLQKLQRLTCSSINYTLIYLWWMTCGCVRKKMALLWHWFGWKNVKCF